jgi:molybdopterin/thiamine biosynthesis adenylyltransferase
MTGFDYFRAFSRNIGWLTEKEQADLRGKRVAIAGLGGAGGVHLLTLTRLGVGSFHIADFDDFDLVNFNRQAGAAMSTLGRNKAEAMAGMARDINPELDIRVFPEGVTPDNIGAFLDGVDVYVDGLDYFVFDARRRVYAACRERDIPITFAVPLGMGAALLNFLPDGMSFDDYFRLDDAPKSEWPVRFLAGIAPGLLHRHYLVAPEIIDFDIQRVPSTGIACQLCAGLAGTEALKILLRRGRVWGVPHTLHFDAYTGKLKHSWRPGGNANPLQRAIIAYILWRLSKLQAK